MELGGNWPAKGGIGKELRHENDPGERSLSSQPGQINKPREAGKQGDGVVWEEDHVIRGAGRTRAAVQK